MSEEVKLRKARRGTIGSSSRRSGRGVEGTVSQFLVASDDDLNRFFKKLKLLDSPDREMAFVSCCLKQDLTSVGVPAVWVH